MRLLVTGGAGYLGRELVARAAAQGWAVRATWWQTPPSGDAEWVRADVRDPNAMHRVSEGADAVVHTAYVQSDSETIVAGTEAVARAAVGRRFIHLSSDIVFDGRKGGYVESDLVAPVNAYGRAKAAAERSVATIHAAATLVRTSLIYGGAEPGPQERLARGTSRFFVDEIRSPVQVTDLAAAIVEALGHDLPGPLHLAGADAVSRYDFALLLGADAGTIEATNTTADRAPNVSLDCAYAASILATRLRGVREVLL